MNYQHFHYVSKEYTQINLEYLILNMIHGNSNSSLHVGADILNLLLWYEIFMFFHV